MGAVLFILAMFATGALVAAAAMSYDDGPWWK